MAFIAEPPLEGIKHRLYYTLNNEKGDYLIPCGLHVKNGEGLRG